MFRRLSSLRRVAVDHSLSLLHRYYPDAKTSRHPSRLASFSFAWRYHGRAGDLLPCEGRRALAGPGCWLQAATRSAAELSVEMTGSPKFPQNPLSLCTCSYDPGRTGQDSPHRPADTAPETETSKASSIALSRLNRMAWRLTVYASPCRLPGNDARLACGCWLSFTARDSDPQGSEERFQLCVIHISSSSRELAWRNSILFRSVPSPSPLSRVYIELRDASIRE